MCFSHWTTYSHLSRLEVRFSADPIPSSSLRLVSSQTRWYFLRPDWGWLLLWQSRVCRGWCLPAFPVIFLLAMKFSWQGLMFSEPPSATRRLTTAPLPTSLVLFLGEESALFDLDCRELLSLPQDSLSFHLLLLLLWNTNIDMDWGLRVSKKEENIYWESVKNFLFPLTSHLLDIRALVTSILRQPPPLGDLPGHHPRPDPLSDSGVAGEGDRSLLERLSLSLSAVTVDRQTSCCVHVHMISHLLWRLSHLCSGAEGVRSTDLTCLMLGMTGRGVTLSYSSLVMVTSLGLGLLTW